MEIVGGGGGWGDDNPYSKNPDVNPFLHASKSTEQHLADGTNPFINVTSERKKPSILDAMFYVGSRATSDSVRGFAQWTGHGEERMAAEQRYMEELMSDPDVGPYATAAYYTGLFADPVAWALPVSRLKHIKTAKDFFTKFFPMAAGSGAVAGGLSYIPEGTQSLVGEGDMTRTEMAGIGAVANTALSPVALAIGKGVKKVYEPIGEAAWTAMKHPAGSGSTVGGLVGYNVEPDASQEDKLRNMALGAALGGTTFAIPKTIDKMRGNTQLSDMFGDAIIPNFKLADDMIYAMNRFRGRKSLYAKEWESVLRGIRDMPMADRKVLYRMLQNRNMGIGTDDFDLEKLGIASESRAMIQEYGQALVNLGVLDERTFLKNIDDYLHTSYMKHDWDMPIDPVSNLRASQHMFKMRGNVKAFDKVAWERGERPDDLGAWEVIEDGVNGMRVRRQWTKEEKLAMGEIEDAGYAMMKTGMMMGHERGLGELFKELAQSPNVVLPQGPKTVKVPTNGQWGDLGGKYVDPRTWDQLKKFREYTGPSTLSLWANRYKAANGVWKGFKTIVSPPVHFANFVSSGHMYDMANGDWADVGRAAKQMYKQDEMFDQMVEDGVLGHSFVNQLREGKNEVLMMYGNSGSGYVRIGDGPGGLNRAMDWTTRVMRKVKETVWDNAAKLYQLEDNIWRAGLYNTKLREAKAMGMSEMKARGWAARQAKEFFVDYDQNPPLLNAMRHTFLPFFSYTYGIMPRLAEVATKNPAKYMKWAGIYAGMNQLGELTSGEDDYLINRTKELIKDNPMMGMPFMPNARVTLPEVASEAVAPDSLDLQSLNAERWLPGGTFSLSEGGTGQIPFFPNAIQPSGGLAGAVGWPILGINQFQGTDIPEGKKFESAVRNILPNWEYLNVGGIRSWAEQKNQRARSGETSRFQDDYSPLSARFSNAGIRIEPLNPRKLAGRIRMKYNQKLKDVKKEMSRIRRERSYSDEEKAKRLEEQREKRRRIQEDMRRALGSE